MVRLFGDGWVVVEVVEVLFWGFGVGCGWGDGL
jgi:hypothetical protein